MFASTSAFARYEWTLTKSKHYSGLTTNVVVLFTQSISDRVAIYLPKHEKTSRSAENIKPGGMKFQSDFIIGTGNGIFHFHSITTQFVFQLR